MSEFLLALGLFLLAHSIPARPAIRGRLVGALGEANYLILYALLSLALLAWLISSALRADSATLWPTQVWSYHLALAVLLPASWLLVGGLSTPNPFSVSLSRAAFNEERPGIVGLVRHPVLWAFALWAGVHAIANGDVVLLILFGVFLVFSFGGMALLDRRKKRQVGPEWNALVRSIGRAWSSRQVLTTFGGGTLLYLLLLGAHPVVIGPNPLAFLP